VTRTWTRDFPRGDADSPSRLWETINKLDGFDAAEIAHDFQGNKIVLTVTRPLPELIGQRDA
jgi:hypothetical protein